MVQSERYSTTEGNIVQSERYSTTEGDIVQSERYSTTAGIWYSQRDIVQLRGI